MWMCMILPHVIYFCVWPRHPLNRNYKDKAVCNEEIIKFTLLDAKNIIELILISTIKTLLILKS